MNEMNRRHNCTNPHQGSCKRVLCVCSAGLLRSPTAAVVLSQEPFNFNTRAAGIVGEYALVPVDAVLVAWADEIVCVSEEVARITRRNFPEADTKIKVLDIPDRFAYRDPELMRIIAEQYAAASVS